MLRCFIVPIMLITFCKASNTGNEMLISCEMIIKASTDKDYLLKTTSEEYGNMQWMIGYLNGYFDSFHMEKARGHKIFLYCLPSDVNVLQLARIFQKFLQDNPEKLHEPGAILLEKAIQESFPCKDQ